MRRWADIAGQEPKYFQERKKTGAGFWNLVKRVNSIRELNDWVERLRQQGAVVNTITSHIKTTKPFRSVYYFIWQNTITGQYLAETRIEEPEKRASDIQAKTEYRTQDLIKR